MIEPTALLTVIAFAVAIKTMSIVMAAAALVLGGIIIWGMRH